MRVLVIEDEKPISAFLKEALEAEYFAVDIAEDGERGAYESGINEYDLIILDIALPKKSGIEVCKEIRARGQTTPILILSAKNDITKKVDLLNAGADDYLTKPFSLQELLARMRALLRRPTGIEEEVLKAGNITLDTKRCTVTKGKKEIYLTRKEFMLLRYLMKNAGTVLSRGMILEHVWDRSVDIFSNTIESHILSLRKKIDTGKDSIIRTIPGRGYKIDD